MGQPESKIIAAIYFGTSYMGFAYAFSEDMQHIFTGSYGSFLPEDRVPTVLLLNPDETFRSFGADAEDKYSILVQNDKHHDFRLFREFKMALYSENGTLQKTLSINDTEGRPKKAIDVFSIIIKHLKELILKSMKQSKAGITSTFEGKIQWMLTIPAIWSDSARQFMRLAATQGGIPENKLRLVLEPEAAALFCKSQHLKGTEDEGVTKLSPGMKYILADLGGGTVDICAHEILYNENIRELYRVQGGALGGSSVNKEFIQLLLTLFGEPIWKKFHKGKQFDYLRVMREFERNKKKFKFKQALSLIIDIPHSLVEMLEKDSLSSLKKLVTNGDFSEFIDVKENKLDCNKKIMEGFFKPYVKGIIEKLREIISECKNDIDALFLVGGYAESRYVREIIKKEIDQINVILVQQPHLAVLKGAVLMGINPKNIIERRARYTYGFSVSARFERGIHPDSLKFTRDEEVLCDKLFSKVIEKDQILKWNQEFKMKTVGTFRQAGSKRVDIPVALYITDKREPKYCIEGENCIQAGIIVVKSPDEGWKDYTKFEQILTVGETELTVKAIDMTSGNQYETYVDFL